MIYVWHFNWLTHCKSLKNEMGSQLSCWISYFIRLSIISGTLSYLQTLTVAFDLIPKDNLAFIFWYFMKNNTYLMFNLVFTKGEKNTFDSLKFLVLLVKDSHKLNSCYLLKHNFKVFLNNKCSAYYLELQLCNFHCHHCNRIPFIINRHAVMLGKME